MIAFKNINIAFDKQTVFEAFSLNIKRGDKVLLSAPSGKGKSTLMKALLGFQRIDGGQIEVDGQVLSRETLHGVRAQIAYVSQDVELGQKTCGNLLDEVFAYKKNRHLSVDKAKYIELGKEFALPSDFLSKSISQLSGGERQRLGFIICILLKRPIWILDEITSGLDKALKERIVEYVLSGEETVLITSHDDIWLDYPTVKVVTW